MAGPNSEFNKDDYQMPVTEKATQSKADRSPKNVSALVSAFASIIKFPLMSTSENQTEWLEFKYADGTSVKPSDNPADYEVENTGESKAMKKYKKAAEKSKRLKVFQDSSPANITYFQ